MIMTPITLVSLLLLLLYGAVLSVDADSNRTTVVATTTSFLLNLPLRSSITPTTQRYEPIRLDANRRTGTMIEFTVTPLVTVNSSAAVAANSSSSSSMFGSVILDFSDSTGGFLIEPYRIQWSGNSITDGGGNGNENIIKIGNGRGIESVDENGMNPYSHTLQLAVFANVFNPIRALVVTNQFTVVAPSSNVSFEAPPLVCVPIFTSSSYNSYSSPPATPIFLSAVSSSNTSTPLEMSMSDILANATAVWRFTSNPPVSTSGGTITDGVLSLRLTSGLAQTYNLLLPNEFGVTIPFFGGADRSYSIAFWHRPRGAFLATRGIFACGGGSGQVVNGQNILSDSIQWLQDERGTLQLVYTLDGGVVAMLEFATPRVRSQVGTWQLLHFQFDAATKRLQARVNTYTQTMVVPRNILAPSTVTPSSSSSSTPLATSFSVCQLGTGLRTMTTSLPIGYDGGLTQLVYHARLLTTDMSRVMLTSPPVQVYGGVGERNLVTVTPNVWLSGLNNSVVLVATMTPTWLCPNSNLTLTYADVDGRRVRVTNLTLVETNELRFVIPSSARLPVTSTGNALQSIALELTVDGFSTALDPLVLVSAVQPIASVQGFASGLGGVTANMTLAPKLASATRDYTLVTDVFGLQDLRVEFEVYVGAGLDWSTNSLTVRWNDQLVSNVTRPASVSGSASDSASSFARLIVPLPSRPFGVSRLVLVSSVIGVYTFQLKTPAPSLTAVGVQGLVTSSGLVKPLYLNTSFTPLTLVYSITAGLAFDKIILQFLTVPTDRLTVMSLALDPPSGSGSGSSNDTATPSSQQGPFTLPGPAAQIDLHILAGRTSVTVKSRDTGVTYRFEVTTPREFQQMFQMTTVGPDNSTAALPTPTMIASASGNGNGNGNATTSYTFTVTIPKPSVALRISFESLARDDQVTIYLVSVPSSSSSLVTTRRIASSTTTSYPVLFLLPLESGRSILTYVTLTGNYTYHLTNPVYAIIGMEIAPIALTRKNDTTAPSQDTPLSLSPSFRPFQYLYTATVPSSIVLSSIRVTLVLNTDITSIRVALDTTRFTLVLIASGSVVVPIRAGATNTLEMTSSNGLVTRCTIEISSRSRAKLIVTPPSVRFVDAPSEIHANDILQLHTQVVHLDPLTSSSMLTYTWTCSDASLVLWERDVVQGAINASSIIVNPLQFAPGEYTLTLTVTDVDFFHATDESDIVATSIATRVRVKAKVQFILQAVSNPCAKVSPCLYGGTCVGVTIPEPPNSHELRNELDVGLWWRLSCACLTSPVAFFGPTCSFAIVRCRDCLTSSPFVGNKTIDMFGIGFNSLLTLEVAGRSLSFLPPRRVNASENTEVATGLATLRTMATATSFDSFATMNALEVLTFTTPSLVALTETAKPPSTALEPVNTTVTGGNTNASTSIARSLVHSSLEFALTPLTIDSYQLLTLSTILPGTSDIFQLNFTNLIFYSSSACTEVGQWKSDGRGGCLPCPESVEQKRRQNIENSR